MNCWVECMTEEFEEVGIVATKKQIETVASWAEDMHDNYSTATGWDVSNANYISDEARELKQLKDELEKQRIFECETKPCGKCLTTGVVKDGWGREVKCENCDVLGRTRF